MVLLALVSTVIPHVPMNKGVSEATTGILILDALPLLTMLPAVSTLRLHARARRWQDVALFGIGFLLAVVYHVAHMMPGGISGAVVLGLPGSTWRTLDILWAQALLARLLGHGLGARGAPTLALSNAAFPAAVWGVARLRGGITLGLASKILAAVAASTVASKALLEGWHSLPRYDVAKSKSAIGESTLGW